MTQQILTQKYVNFFLLYVFVFSIFIDIYNGYIQQVSSSNSYLPYIYKGIVVIMVLPSVFHKNKFNNLIYVIFCLFIFCLSYWFTSSYIIDIGYEIVTALKLLYPYVIASFLIIHNKYISKEKIINYIIIYGLIAGISIISTALLDIAVVSYGNDYGFGVRGFFKGGNDIGLALLMCNCITCYMYNYTNRIRYLLCCILLTASAILLGSVAGTLGSIVIIVLLTLNWIFIKKNNKKTFFKKIINALIILSILMVSIMTVIYIVNYDSYTISKFSVERLLSGGAREELRIAILGIYKTYDIMDVLFGRGDSFIVTNIGTIIDGAGITRTVELDQYELLTAYGVLLGGILLLLPIILALSFIKRYFLTKNAFYFWGSVALILFLFHGFTAGHAFVNVVALQIIAGLYLCFKYNSNEKIIINQ